MMNIPSECRSANIVRDHAVILSDDAIPKPDETFGKDRSHSIRTNKRQLHSFGDDVLIRRGLPVKWIEFSEATGGRSCGSCSREEVGRFDRSRFAVGVHGGLPRSRQIAPGNSESSLPKIDDWSC